MIYFVLPIFLYITSELVGTISLKKIGLKSFKFNGLIGFAVILAFYYILCFPMVALNVKFVVLFLTTILYFIVLWTYVFINKCFINFEFKIFDVLFVMLLVLLQIYFASRNTVGSLWRYDTITYTNMITGSIYGTHINDINFANGYGTGFNAGYSFQSYYKLASVLYYLMNGVANKLHINFFYFTQHTWMYSSLLYLLVSQMIINFIDVLKINKKSIQLMILLFFILFMGNFYWNSEQAYLGNSFRMIMTSYCLYYLYQYFEDYNNKNLLIFAAFNYANVACANSNSTLVIILTFMVFVLIPNKKNNLKILLAGTYLPVINCLFQAISYSVYIVVCITVIYSILWVLESKLFLIVDKLHLKMLMPIVVFLLLVALSFKVTGNLFDFNAFLNNWSGWSDMTWDYTDCSSLWRMLANVSYLFLMIMMLSGCEQKHFKLLVLLTTLIFFNPFASAIQNTYMPVFYRNYDIVINYFTLFIGFKHLNDIKINVSILNSLYLIMILIFSYVGYNQLVYHPEGESFDKSDDYNTLLKMDNDTADALLFMKEYLVSNNIKDGKAISSIYQLRTEFPYLKTLYNRNKEFNGKKEDYELYKIFYPEDYYGDEYGFNDAQYNNIYNLLESSDYNFLILGKNKMYYDKDNDIYYSLTYKINEYFSPVYDNDTYSIYIIH